MSRSRRRRVVIYRDHLLPGSNTFIRSQGEALADFDAFYVGSKKVEGLDLPAERVRLLDPGGLPGRMRELAFKLRGSSSQLTREVQALQPELVHAHFGPDATLAQPIAESLDIPLIVTFHGFDITMRALPACRRYPYFLFYLLRKPRLRRRATRFVAVSEFIRDRLLAEGFPDDRIVVHYIGVDTEYFTRRSPPTHDPVILFVGRLVEKKGCKYLIRAAEILEKKGLEPDVVIVGDGPLRAELEREAAARTNSCRFLGALPPQEVRSWIERSRIFCGPSVIASTGDAEALGIVFLEAQSMGVPVASFASGGIPEAVEHGVTGLLAPPEDHRTLAEHLERLLRDDESWSAMGTAGRRRMEEHFDLERQTRKLEGIYEDTLTSWGRLRSAEEP